MGGFLAGTESLVGQRPRTLAQITSFMLMTLKVGEMTDCIQVAKLKDEEDLLQGLFSV